MENIIDRLDKYMLYKGLNDNKVTVQAGLSVGLLGKARIAKKGLHSDSIEKILHAFPDLNPVWLVLGNGLMLISKDYPPNRQEYQITEDSPSPEYNKACKVCAEKDNRIKDLLAQIDRLDKMLNRLTSHDNGEQKRKVG